MPGSWVSARSRKSAKATKASIHGGGVSAAGKSGTSPRYYREIPAHWRQALGIPRALPDKSIHPAEGSGPRAGDDAGEHDAVQGVHGIFFYYLYFRRPVHRTEENDFHGPLSKRFISIIINLPAKVHEKYNSYQNPMRPPAKNMILQNM